MGRYRFRPMDLRPDKRVFAVVNYSTKSTFFNIFMFRPGGSRLDALFLVKRYAYFKKNVKK